jgi:hypothetical protein
MTLEGKEPIDLLHAARYVAQWERLEPTPKNLRRCEDAIWHAISSGALHAVSFLPEQFRAFRPYTVTLNDLRAWYDAPVAEEELKREYWNALRAKGLAKGAADERTARHFRMSERQVRRLRTGWPRAK